MVNEPENWHCYTRDAGKYGLNAYFCMGNENFYNAAVVMYIRVMTKDNHSADEHLQGDMEDFRDKYSDIKYDDFSITDLTYNNSSKIYIYNNYRDYVCYLEPDPAPESPLYLIFVLSGPEETAHNYQADFIKLVQSFQWLGYFHKVK